LAVADVKFIEVVHCPTIIFAGAVVDDAIVEGEVAIVSYYSTVICCAVLEANTAYGDGIL
jgi:hypothetical protein